MNDSYTTALLDRYVEVVRKAKKFEVKLSRDTQLMHLIEASGGCVIFIGDDRVLERLAGSAQWNWCAATVNLTTADMEAIFKLVMMTTDVINKEIMVNATSKAEKIRDAVRVATEKLTQ